MEMVGPIYISLNDGKTVFNSVLNFIPMFLHSREPFLRYLLKKHTASF